MVLLLALGQGRKTANLLLDLGTWTECYTFQQAGVQPKETVYSHDGPITQDTAFRVQEKEYPRSLMFTVLHAC